MTLDTFTTLTLQAARTVPDAGRFGDKAWIHAVWAWGRFARLGLDLPAFQARLWEACQSGKLQLSRCDMVEAFTPFDVRRSQMEVLGATFNFIRVP